MAIPLMCAKCGDIIGTEPKIRSLERLHSGNFDPSVEVECPGRGNHPKPKRSETTELHGLIRKITQEYPETHTVSLWKEYVGPPKKFWLWFAIVFGTKKCPNSSYRGVTVNNKWAWWNLRIGLCGDGVEELSNLQQAV